MGTGGLDRGPHCLPPPELQIPGNPGASAPGSLWDGAAWMLEGCPVLLTWRRAGARVDWALMGTEPASACDLLPFRHQWGRPRGQLGRAGKPGGGAGGVPGGGAWWAQLSGVRPPSRPRLGRLGPGAPGPGGSSCPFSREAPGSGQCPGSTWQGSDLPSQGESAGMGVGEGLSPAPPGAPHQPCVPSCTLTSCPRKRSSGRCRTSSGSWTPWSSAAWSWRSACGPPRGVSPRPPRLRQPDPGTPRPLRPCPPPRGPRPPRAQPGSLRRRLGGRAHGGLVPAHSREAAAAAAGVGADVQVRPPPPP